MTAMRQTGVEKGSTLDGRATGPQLGDHRVYVVDFKSDFASRIGARTHTFGKGGDGEGAAADIVFDPCALKHTRRLQPEVLLIEPSRSGMSMMGYMVKAMAWIMETLRW